MNKTQTREYLCVLAVIGAGILTWISLSTWWHAQTIYNHRAGYQVQKFVVTGAYYKARTGKGHASVQWLKGRIEGREERLMLERLRYMDSEAEVLRYFPIGTTIDVLFNPNLESTNFRMFKCSPNFWADVTRRLWLGMLGTFIPLPLALLGYLRAKKLSDRDLELSSAAGTHVSS